MRPGNELDINTLSWVKSEIDETLNQARTSLEAYVEDTADDSKLQFCLNYLHQVRGTLQMVELYGAAMAAEEMEHLAQALIENQVSNRQDAYEVLMRGILQLPDYLEHLLTGHKDIPVLLMPLLNDLRASRGEALLSENSLFSPDLSIKSPANDLVMADISELARKLRHNYHLGLLGWFRDKDSEASLKRIGDVINQLREAAGEEEMNRLLWVAGGLVESLRHGGIDSSVSIKLLLGQLDRQIKKVIDEGMMALSDEPPTDLLKNLLYYVATSTSADERTRDVKQTFRLDEVMPDTHTLEQARADLAGPNAALMDTVSSVLLEDLTGVKDTLDVFMRKEERDPQELKPLSETLTQMADTLGMMGLGLQRRVVLDQIEILTAVAEGQRELTETDLMDVAGAMLSLETSLKEASVARAANEEAEEIGETGEAQQKLHDAEQQKLLATVIEQARGEFAHVKDALNDFSRNTATVDVLEGIPGSLDQIRGSLAILSLGQAADLLSQCNSYVQDNLLSKRIIPDEDVLDTLADAISSVEYYLESLAGKWGNPETILDIAVNSLARLGEIGQQITEDAVESTYQDLAQPEVMLTQESVVADEDDTVVDLQAPSDEMLSDMTASTFTEKSDISAETLLSDDEDTFTEITLDDVPLPGADDESAPLNFDLDQTTELSLKGFEEGLQVEGVDEPVDENIPTVANTLDDVIQPEIEGLTLESSDTLPSDSDDTMALSIDDLDFAPLESGPSMDNVNAVTPTDNELNIDIGSAPEANEEPPAQLEESVLGDEPGIVADEAVKPDESFIGYEPSSQSMSMPDILNASSSSIQMVVEPPEEIDEEIIEIFLEEAEEEFENISQFLPQWENNMSDEESLKDMRRSFHTLKGSGRLVGAKDLGEFAWAYENMLNRVIEKTVEVTPVMIEVLHLGHKMLPHLYELFKTGSQPEQDVFALMGYADDLSQGKNVELAPVQEQVDESEPLADLADEAPVQEHTAEAELVVELADEEPAQEQTPEAELVVELNQTAESEPAIELVEELSFEELPSLEGIPAEPAPLEGIDPVLLDIYRKEVDTHLSTLREYLNGWHASMDRSANDNLLRALHTLTGSSRTTGVTSVSELCCEFEKYTKDLQQGNNTISAEAAALLEDTVVYIVDTTSVLDQPGASISDNSSLLERVNALFHSIPDVAVVEEPPTIEEVVQQDSVTVEEMVPALKEGVEPPAVPRDYDEELLEIFIEEGEEILEESDRTLSHWIENPDDPDDLEALQRHLHTLKGGARMAGVLEIGDLGHSIESMLTAVVDGHLAVSKRMFGLIQRSHDRLATLLEQVKNHQGLSSADDLIREVDEELGRSSLGHETESISPEPTTESVTKAEALYDLETKVEPEEPIEAVEVNEPQPPELDDEFTIPVELDKAPAKVVPKPDNVFEIKPQSSEEVSIEEVPEAPLAGAGDRRKAPRIQQEQIRVRADLLDNLVNFAGEVSIYRSRMEQQTNSFRYNLRELDETVSRLRQQLRAFEIETEAQIQYRQEESLSREYAEFDPLEFDRFTHMQQLSRGMLESLSDLDSLRTILANITRESETLLLQQSRVNTELQEGLMRTRMVPFSGQAPRLRRIVRQTSAELGKEVNLKLLGMEGELDRTVLDRIIPPIEHMLRNAIAHGIENAEDRRNSGKPDAGSIELSFEREGSDIVIRVSDDGAGLDLEAIQKKAIARGLLEPGIKVSRDVLLNLIMESGFSTAEEVTQVAGRGVGMDVVNTEIKQLGGLLNIETAQGQGTTFTINMPLTLAITRALMVTVGEETYAVPLLSVHGVERITYQEVQELQALEKPVYRWLDEDYKLMHLGTVMGVNRPVPATDERIPLLLVRSGDFRAAIQVEGLLGSREVVVKPVGPQISTLRGITGATIMGDGQVVLILDLGVLIRLIATTKGEQEIEIPATPVEEIKAKTTVMVVDDSITVRKVTTRLLERHDYEVMTAKDGVDALAQLQESVPDVMLLDVEMPRMDGFELASNIRNDNRLKGIPIIMITSRTAAKHRQRALDIGVNAYLGKPYNEVDLLENIESMLQEQTDN